jgi:predicted methyltransferase
MENRDRLTCSAPPHIRMPYHRGPLLTHDTATAMAAAWQRGETTWSGSLDLGRSTSRVALDADGWTLDGARHAWPDALRERSIHAWDGTRWQPVQRFDGALVKLVPTAWGPPTFEIDGIKMLPTAKVSPWEDARTKVALVAPRGKRVLDTCGGLGYFAACCLEAGAAQVQSFEKNADVLWLRTLNPWSPDPDAPDARDRLVLAQADISQAIHALSAASFDAILHDPPRFGIAGELYSRVFYDQLARVLRPRGRLFHYTGTPNKLTSGRDVPREVARRLQHAGFDTQLTLDGVLATRRRDKSRPR